MRRALLGITLCLTAACQHAEVGPSSSAEVEPVRSLAVASKRCSPSSIAGKTIAPGVTYYDCSGFDVHPRVHIVTIDRTLPAMELKLIAQRASDADKRAADKPTDELWLKLKGVDQLAKSAGAVAAINGFQWKGDSGNLIDFRRLGIPSTTVYMDGALQKTQPQDNEVMMGFTRGGPSGIAVKRMPKETFAAEPDDYRYQAYGSGENVLKDGSCVSVGNPLGLYVPFDYQNDRLSIVGYSPTHVVLLSATGHPYFQQELCPTLQDDFGVTDAVRQDGGHSPSLYVGGSVNEVVNPLAGDCAIDPLVIGGEPQSDPIACTKPVAWAAAWGAVPPVAYALAVVPRATTTSCSQVTDGEERVIGMLCVTPDNTGYDAQLITMGNEPSRCGSFDFSLVAKDGRRVGDEGAFQACTGASAVHSYYFRTGTLGGCATLELLLRAGEGFGRTQWRQPSCGSGRIEPGPGDVDAGISHVDRTAPTTTASRSPGPNASGWSRGDVRVTFQATDAGPVVSGVRAIHVSLSGAQTGSTVLGGASGAVTITAEGTTQVSYFAIDHAGNVEAARSLTVSLDKTPPVIAGMPAPGCTLWAPNHSIEKVATVSASDALSGMASFDVRASSSEPANNKEPDVLVTGSALDPRTVELRAERAGKGTGRIYTVTATASDQADNRATATATCTVPHDQSGKKK